MGHEEVISLDEVRATRHLSQLRQRLHERFDQWLDALEPYLDDTPMSLPDLTTVMWQLGQDLMGRLTETVLTTRMRRRRSKPTLIVPPAIAP